MTTKEMYGQTPTSLKGLMLYKHLYHSRKKEDKREFSRLFFIGARWKREKWLYNTYGEINGDILEERTYRGYEQLCREVVKHFPNLFTKEAKKSYLGK